MNILFFISAFYPFPTGATYSAFRLARALREKGVSVQWVVDDRDGSWKSGGTYEGFNVRSFALHTPGKYRKAKAVLKLMLYLWKIRRQYDIFHVHGGGHMNVLIAGLVKLMFPRKKVMLKCTLDGWDTPDGIEIDKYGGLLLWIYQRLDGIIAMTSGQLAKVRAYRCKGLSRVIPNGTDCERYHPDESMRVKVRSAIGIPDSVPVIIYVGWLGHRKGTDVLLKAWVELLKQHPNLYLLTVGDYLKGKNTDATLIQLLESSGIDRNTLRHPQFVRVGHVEDAERYLQAADIFVFPSRSEGFGTVQTEAMACGLPCVVNDIRGVSSDIFPDTSVGFRVSDNSANEFMRYISELIQHPDIRRAVGGAARRRVVENFSLQSVSSRYVMFYSTLINGLEYI